MTIDTLLGQLGGSGSSQLLDPRDWDVKTGRLRKRGTVLGFDTFDVGYGGWANHFHYATANTLLSRTGTHPYAGRSALLVSPSELPLTQAEKWQGASAYKRGGFPNKLGVQSLSGMFAVRGGRGQDLLTQRLYPFSNWWIGMDTQLPDASARFFGTVMLKDQGDGTLAWYMKGGRQSSAAGSSYRADVKIPGSDMWFTGLNENKVNYCYVRLTVDLAAAAAGVGYYLELQVANRVFDLRAANSAVPYDLLLNNGSHDMFTGGNNAGMGIARSTINPTFNQVHLLADQVLWTTNDLALAA